VVQVVELLMVPEAQAAQAAVVLLVSLAPQILAAGVVVEVPEVLRAAALALLSLSTQLLMA
jgi:hypothetical protein